MALKPTIVRNPADDDAFARAVDDVIDHEAADPARAQSLLRALYPRAVVRRRELDGERADVWYVYREGHWIRGD